MELFPLTAPCIALGDFNAHVAAPPDTPCLCYNIDSIPLQTGSCMWAKARGIKLLYSWVANHGLHMVNRCQYLPTYTFQSGEYQSTVDYILYSAWIGPCITSIDIVNPPLEHPTAIQHAYLTPIIRCSNKSPGQLHPPAPGPNGFIGLPNLTLFGDSIWPKQPFVTQLCLYNRC